MSRADPGLPPTVHTPSQTIGPLWAFSLLYDGCNQTVEPSSPDALSIEGHVFDGEGPVGYPDALVELWDVTQLARCQVDAGGRYHMVVARPVAPALPDGRLQAPHFNVVVFSRGLLKQVHTRLYLPDAEAENANDPVLALIEPSRRETMIAAVDGSGLRFDIRLQGPKETVFLAF